MAIRAGSGGLKYPVPNQAQIQASQNAAAASSGGSAAASVYGANRRYAGLKQQLRYDALQQGLNRGFRAQQAFFDREHQKGSQLSAQEARAEIEAERRKNQLRLQRRQQRFQAGENQLGRDFDAQQSDLDRQFRSDEAQRARDFQADQAILDTEDRENELLFQRRNQLEDREAKEQQLDATIQGRLDSGEWELPPAAQRKLQQLEAGRAQAYAEGTYSEAELEDIDRQFAERRRYLMRTARQKEGPTIGQQFDQRVVYADAEGRRYAGPGQGGQPFVFDGKEFKPLFGEAGLLGLGDDEDTTSTKKGSASSTGTAGKGRAQPATGEGGRPESGGGQKVYRMMGDGGPGPELQIGGGATVPAVGGTIPKGFPQGTRIVRPGVYQLPDGRKVIQKKGQ